MRRARKIQPFDTLASRVLGRADTHGKRRGATAVNAWAEVAGEGIAAHTRGFALRDDGELVVFVDSAPWANELSLMSSDLIARLNAHLGQESVTSLRFTVSRKAREGVAAAPHEGGPNDLDGASRIKSVPLDEIEMAQASRVASAVKETTLREAAMRAMIRDLEQKKALRLDDSSTPRKQGDRRGGNEGL